jgi:hypothetical protein
MARMARRLTAMAAVLIAAGLAIAVWYGVWGVHGCNDEGGNPMCDRMDRDFSIYLAGLAAFGLGVVVAITALVTRRRDGRLRA